MGTSVPFRQYVLKIHSRCDLACDHCYVYEHADQSWRARPFVMPEAVVAQAARRIGEHVRSHGLSGISVVLHGGEPLLVGHERLSAMAATVRAALDEDCAVDMRVHTNGMLLDQAFCRIFREYDIKVGISLDGDQVSHDRHRRYRDGRGSYAGVVQAIDLVRREIPDLYAGLLCTVDVRNDPLAVYRELTGHRPPRIDFLLPHATWDSPPPRPTETAYADWLIRIFDRWQAEGMPVAVRTFDSVIRTTHGLGSLTETIGLEPSDLVVIETDGAIEQADSLKTAYEGAPATGFDVFTDTLDALAGHPGIVARQQGIRALATECRECPVVSSCGGGLYAHRYQTGSGFGNPSVYCRDLLKLIEHIRDRTEPALHIISSGTLDLLARGYGDRAAIASLEETQQTLRRALLAAIPRNSQTAAAWDLIDQADQQDRRCLDEVLAYPFVRVWAAHCLEGKTEAGYLTAVAASVAIRAGLDAELLLPVRAGAVHLPTLGGLLIDKDLDRVRISIRGGSYELAVQSTRLPPRILTAGHKSVVLDDLDPHRDCYRWPTASRLDDGELEAWQHAFSQAWNLIERDYPAYAPGLSAGLKAIVPLAPAERGRMVSATARHAFGAVAIALPADAAVLALLLIHEYQHVKLGAVLDLFDLSDRADTRVYYAPWRDDPRPLEGLLQGAYAHVAVADYWRVRRTALADGEASMAAAAAFARWRDEVLDVLGTMSGSGSLTPLGQRFADGMRRTVAGWLDIGVPDAAIGIAARTASRHRDAWQQKHGNHRGAIPADPPVPLYFN